MRHYLLLLAGLFGALQTAQAQTAPQPGNCTPATEQTSLSVNNVFASIFNNGSLFFGGTTTGGDGYLVPQASRHSPIYASGLWVGGRVGGELRVAGATYGNYNFWPGPLDAATGRPVNPASCSTYDRIYSVTRNDILAYEGGGATAPDLLQWPANLGAPVIDGDGIAGNYSLAGGDRPDIIGDQGLWWVMNDVGGPHTANATPVLGIEVQVLAWAFSRSDALGNTTFYKYRVINKSGFDIEETYLSVFSDPDLGDALDDYVGSDPASGLGYVYNADNIDNVYGVPPAAGYDFFQGPIVPDGNDAGSDLDTLGTSAFAYFTNLAGPSGDPDTGVERYFFMQGLWGDGSEMRSTGSGYQQTTGAVTKFAFPGDPVAGQPWSELNPGTGLPPTGPDDRRFLISTGPFTLENGVPQDIVFGIIFGQGTSNLNSITELRNADLLAQTAYDAGFRLPPPPPAPALCADFEEIASDDTPTRADNFGSGFCLEAVAQNRQVTLVFGYDPSSPNYLGQYEVTDVFLAGQGANDDTYNFEGFKIYRYPTSGFDLSERELVTTLDIVNGVGADNGLAYAFDITNLTNYTDYFYAVSAYAYNVESSPQELESQATPIVVRPAALVGAVQAQSAFGDSLSVSPVTQVGAGDVMVRVIDPTQITGATYQVQFFNPTNPDGTPNLGVTTYRIVNTTAEPDAVVVDGQAYYEDTGGALPSGTNVAIVDGFTFDIVNPAPSFETFLTTRRGDGPLAPFEYAAISTVLNPYPSIGPAVVDATKPTEGQQVGPAEWVIQQGSLPESLSFASFVERTTRGGTNTGIRSNDYEWRFTGNSTAVLLLDNSASLTVPFELWDIGTTPDNPVDDVRLIPLMVPEGTPESFGLGRPVAGPPVVPARDHRISVGDNDPFTDWIYWYRPTNETPGTAGYNAFANGGGTPNLAAIGDEIFARMVLVNVDGGNIRVGNYNQALPETGTIFRIVTTNSNIAGDTFTFNTAAAALTAPSLAEREVDLDRIAIVPNPYLATSGYETGNLSRVVRFTNLPLTASTIRIYTVSGSLVRTLTGGGPSRSIDWNLETSNNLPVASGMYLVHVDVEGVGERTLKLGVVTRRTQVSQF